MCYVFCLLMVSVERRQQINSCRSIQLRTVNQWSARPPPPPPPPQPSIATTDAPWQLQVPPLLPLRRSAGLVSSPLYPCLAPLPLPTHIAGLGVGISLEKRIHHRSVSVACRHMQGGALVLREGCAEGQRACSPFGSNMQRLHGYVAARENGECKLPVVHVNSDMAVLGDG